jgi:excisionase family DNA binding protein
MESESLVVNVREAARLLSLSPWTIRLYLRTGKLRAVKIGRRILLERSELRRIIELGRKPTEDTENA